MLGTGLKRKEALGSFDDVEDALRKTEILGVALLVVAIAAAVVFGVVFNKVLIILSASIAMMLAMGGVGAFLGFLFAIPRTGAPSRPIDATPASQDGHLNGVQKGEKAAAVVFGMSTNSNLVEISDWLTKIIVGIGLTQLTNLDEALGKLGSAMEQIVPGVAGLGIYFNCLAVASVLYGFLFFYVQTRTRGVMMFAWMETLQRVASASPSPDVTTPQFADSPFEASSRRADGVTPPAPPVAKDREILAAGPEKLSTANQFAAFAAALVRNNDLTAGASAWMDAIKRDVDKEHPEFRKRLAEVLFAQKRPKEAMSALRDAIAAEKDQDAALKLKRNALFNALYLGQPNSFIEAKPLSDELLASQKYAKDPWVLLWTISALGQQADWMSKNQQGGDLSQVKAEVLKRVAELKAVTEPASEQRLFLKQILDPAAEGGSPSENDLEIFKNDPEVRAAVTG